jgi:putative ABC transport system ATP-binding protein
MPRVSTLDNVAQPLIYRGLSPAVRQQRAKEALERVGLEHRLLHKPNELSGGQRQRVAVARALVGRPEVLLADEPTGNLDSKTAKEILGLFAELHRDGITVVIVTHDPVVAGYCHRVVRLHDGRIAEDRRQEPTNDVAIPVPSPVVGEGQGEGLS